MQHNAVPSSGGLQHGAVDPWCRNGFTIGGSKGALFRLLTCPRSPAERGAVAALLRLLLCSDPTTADGPRAPCRLVFLPGLPPQISHGGSSSPRAASHASTPLPRLAVGVRHGDSKARLMLDELEERRGPGKPKEEQGR
jgi:hypothetical protein